MIRTTFGGVTLELIETASGTNPRYRVEVDGERHRVRVRKTFDGGGSNSHDWIEGDDGELATLVGLLKSERATRSDDGGRLELHEYEPVLPHNEDSTTVTVCLGASRVVEVDMTFRYGDVNPNFGW